MFLFFKTVDSVVNDIVDNMDDLKQLAERHRAKEAFYAALVIQNRQAAARASKVANKLENILGD